MPEPEKGADRKRKGKHLEGVVEEVKKIRLDIQKYFEEGQRQLQERILKSYLSTIETDFPHLLDDANQKRFMQDPKNVEWILGKDINTWERIIQESSTPPSFVKAWSARYGDPKGANLDRLLKQFDNGNQEYTKSIYGGDNKSPLAKPIYMNGFSIVQTSGSGKSRSIVELKQKGVFVCYCSFQQGRGVPLRSPTLAKYVEDYCRSVDSAMGYVRAWLVVLKKWCQAKRHCVDWCEEHVIIESTQKSRILDEVCREWDAVNDCREEDLRCLLDDLEKFTRKSGVKVLFAFDESRHLFKEDGIGFYLRRVITIPGIMATFVDTKASFIDISPPASLDPSLRPRLDQATVLRPFWELLTTNCLSMDLNQTEYPTSEELLDFGRPLWAAERRGGTDVIALAASKLVGGAPHAELENLRNGKELSQWPS